MTVTVKLMGYVREDHSPYNWVLNELIQSSKDLLLFSECLIIPVEMLEYGVINLL